MPAIHADAEGESRVANVPMLFRALPGSPRPDALVGPQTPETRGMMLAVQPVPALLGLALAIL